MALAITNPPKCPMQGKSQCSMRDTEHHLSQMLYRPGMLSITTTAPEASFSWSYSPGHQIQYCFSQIKSKSALSSLNWPNALMRTNQLQFSLLMLEVPGIYLFSCSWLLNLIWLYCWCFNHYKSFRILFARLVFFFVFFLSPLLNWWTAEFIHRCLTGDVIHLMCFEILGNLSCLLRSVVTVG